MANAANNLDSAFTYIPNPDYNGGENLTCEICDSGIPSLCDTTNVTLIANPVNDFPLAADDSAATAEEAAVTIEVPRPAQ